MGKPAGFIELTIIGQIGFGNDAENLPLMEHSGAVVQFAFD